MDNTKLVVVLFIIVLLFALVVAVVLYWYKQQSPHQEMPLDGDYGLGNGGDNNNYPSPRQPDKPLLDADGNRSFDDASSPARAAAGGRQGGDLSRSVGRGPSGALGASYNPPRGGKGKMASPNNRANPLTNN